MRASALALVLFIASEARAASAIAEVAQELGKGAAQVPAGGVVVAAPIVSDVPMNKGDELALRVASVLAGKLRASASDKALTLAGAHAAAKGKPAVVFVRVEIARGELRATLDAFPVIANGWDRVRLPPPAPIAHAFASAPIDAEVRALMPPIPLEQATAHKAKHEEGEVLAAACGSLDGSLAVALVSRERVALGRLRQGKFVVIKSAPWSALSARAPVPLREPLAGASFEGELLVGTTDRAPVALDAELKPRGAITGIPIGIGLCARADATAFTSVGPCRGEGALDLGLKRFDAAAMADVTDARGQTQRAFALREPSGKLHTSDPKRALEGAGAEVAVADLDLDGTAEIVSSASGDPDAITVTSQGGRVRLKLAAPAGVRALCACPPEEHGAPGVIAVVGDEVWLVR